MATEDPTPTPTATPTATPETPPNPPGPLATPPHQAPPSAAKVVLEGPKTERELALERQLEEERKGRKAAETDAAHLQDENRRLKDVPTPEPKPKKKKKAGWTFFDDDE